MTVASLSDKIVLHFTWLTLSASKIINNWKGYYKMNMEDSKFLKRIQLYAEDVLGDIDPQKVPVSTQLEKLKPIMDIIAKEENMALQEVFIKYMDLASEFAVSNEKEFQSKLND